jgi:hypothetical protein
LSVNIDQPLPQIVAQIERWLAGDAP